MSPQNHETKLGAAQGRNVATQSKSPERSTRETPPVPPQVEFNPKDVTPARTFELPMKFGPPESPKHVPPVFALFDYPRNQEAPGDAGGL